MSQYFRPRRAATSSSTSESFIPFSPRSDDLHRSDGSDIDNSNHGIASSAILIFPNPASERESSRSRGGFDFSGSSTLSLPTDMSLESVRSMSRSRSRGGGERERERVHDRRRERRQSLLPIFPRDDGDWDELLVEEQEQEQEQEQAEWELENGYSSSYNMRYRTSSPHDGRHARTCSSTGLSSSLIPRSSLSPQTPFRLPFLSFLQSFLTLDESTLDLISRSLDPHLSSLFPVSPGLHAYSNSMDNEDGAASVDAAEPPPPHGALKLLLSNPDKPQSAALLKAGMDPSETDCNPLLINPTRVSVWRLLECVIEGGVRAWKEVRVWNAGGTRLMGV